MRRLRAVIHHWKIFGFKAVIVTIAQKFRAGIRNSKSSNLKNIIISLNEEFSSKNLAIFKSQNQQKNKIKNLTELVRERFPTIQPLRGFHVPGSGKRLNLVTDSINRGTLFGGVATALIFSALLSEKLKCNLRIVTKTEPAHKQNFQHIIKLSGIPWNRNIDFAYTRSSDAKAELPVGDEDIFLTTSWWTTKSVMETFGSNRIIYLLQEDERSFYPYGDDYLRCSDVLRDTHLEFIINTKLLYDHFLSEGFENIRNKGQWFEPSWPRNIFFLENQKPKAKKNFFFYARPNNLRNLFYLGLEVINSAVSNEILNPDEWDFYFVGKDIPKVTIKNSHSPQIFQNINFDTYASLVRKMDLGLCLMYTPHPSYPPLDLAASGAVVVTNKYANKQSLENYSKNIICSELNIASLVQGIKEGTALARNSEVRIKNFRENKILHDWNISFEHVLSRLER